MKNSIEVFKKAAKEVGYERYIECSEFEEYTSRTIVNIEGAFGEDVLMVLDKIKEISNLKGSIRKEATHIKLIIEA